MPEAAEATRAEGYTALEAQLNHDGTVSLVVAGEPLPGCNALPMDSVLVMLVRYARENGTILLASTHPNGRVTHDLVTPEGEVTPYYPPQQIADHTPEAAEEADPAEAVVFDALRRHGRRRAGEPAVEAPAQAEPLKTRVQLGAGDIPRFNVEADIEKAMAAKNPPRSRTKAIVLAVLVTVIVLGAVAAAGWLFLAHGGAAAPHAAAAWAATGPPAA
jgi:hypothetical protein